MKQPDAQTHNLTRTAQDRFIREWGRMSSSWGINRTMAQIHALFLATGKELTTDEVIERLHISRGNANMNLRDLNDWGIITRFRNTGDRKDIYAGDEDVVSMFAHVVRERKRREIDPTVAAIKECLQMVPPNDESEEATVFRTRLETLLEIFNLIDAVYEQVFESDHAFKQTISHLSKTTELKESSRIM